jgi:hypothetical protein
MNANRNTKTILNLIKSFIKQGYETQALEILNDLINQIENNEITIKQN